MTGQLGRLERVELRTAWKDEALDFTPWLAKSENLALLEEAIGIELELDSTEKNVGPFRADILCKDVATGNWLLIENQLTRTDHTHLGQLMTYAAGLDAVTVVWVAEKFTEEHRAALDWLNEVTTERASFFGLEVELWRIGTSPIAPKFNVISKPNDWTRSVARSAGSVGEPSDTALAHQEYWAAMADYLETKGSILRPTKPLPQHWMNFSIGRSNFWVSTVAGRRDGFIGVELNLGGPEAKPHFHLLRAQAGEIEREIGEVLDWQEKPDRKGSQVGLRIDADPTDTSAWEHQFEWFRERLDRFASAFMGRIQTLDASEWNPELHVEPDSDARYHNVPADHS